MIFDEGGEIDEETTDSNDIAARNPVLLTYSYRKAGRWVRIFTNIYAVVFVYQDSFRRIEEIKSFISF